MPKFMNYLKTAFSLACAPGFHYLCFGLQDE